MVDNEDKARIIKEEQNSKSAYLKKDLETSESSDQVTSHNHFIDAFQENYWLYLIFQYIGAVLLIILAFGIYSFLTAQFGPGLPTYILFYPAVIIVSLLWGFGPGLVATVTSLSVADIWILPPQGQLSIASTTDLVGLILFLTFGILISAVAELYHRNRIKAVAYDKENSLREARKEKEFLANILEHSSQPFAIGFPDGRLGLFNHAFEELTGYTKQELNTIDWSDALTPVEWREKESQKLDELHRTGQPVRYEKEYVRKDGSRVPIELFVDINMAADGNPEFYYSFISDITKRQKDEADLKRQAALLDVSYEAIFSWEYDDGIISWNVGAEKLYGFSNEEAIGHVSHDLLKTNFPIEFKDFLKILKKNGNWAGELIHTTRDGRLIVVESRQQLIKDFSGKLIVIETNRDITQRKKMEQLLKDSEEKYRTILDNLQDAYIQADSNGIITMVSPSAASMYNYDSPNKMIGNYIKNLYKNQLDRDDLLENLEKLGNVEDYESVALRKDGTTFDVSLNSQFLYDNEGQIQGTEVFVRDITERKNAEKALRVSEQRISDMIESISDYIYAIDSDWNFIFVNETAANDVGYESSELLGKNIWSAVDKVVGTELETNFREAMDKREIKLFDWETVYTDSYKEFTVYPSAEGITVYGKDITKRKKAEKQLKIENERLETILETNPSAVIIVEADGNISYINQRAKDIYGINITGMDLSTAIAKVKAKKIDGSEYSVGDGPTGRALKGQMVRNEEMILEQPDGTVIPILGSAAPIYNLENQIISAVVIFDDITQIKQEEWRKQKMLEKEQQLTEELSATNEELQATTEELKTSNEDLILAQNSLMEMVTKLKTSNKELEQFAYVASHDLQEPLRMVASFTQLLERRYKNHLDDDANDYIDFIVEGAQRMKDLIDDLLAFSRLNTEVHKFEPILVEVALDDVSFNLKSSIEENNATITYDPLPTINGDPSQIRQLFQNLISNAIKFHGDTPPKIHVSAQELDDECIFGVTDNGIGINQNHQEQIFSIFKRLHTRKDYEGTGIGLAICKRIVERHGGKIWVESEEGNGSTFYFTISNNQIVNSSNGLY
ncbi:multi-sensor signal transduction histidine kinase [Methanobacterium lacus]|uniref:histidine kinase n=1 Tax=Methanobacterium lacus (strain AL-21) TaxID=877455 RepID=F0TCV8_METLA|nr:PAS domain S-box protein [Methanobacterium lacus]ADZ10498.1 multi-sensor signal transduction histidine kinase [Methanobacterium lacus]